MKVRACEKQLPWNEAEGTWFHDHKGEAFEVLAIHANPHRLYQVDVAELFERGETDTRAAFIPDPFAELLR